MQLLYHVCTMFLVTMTMMLVTATSSIGDDFNGVNNADNAFCHSNKENDSPCRGDFKDPR